MLLASTLFQVALKFPTAFWRNTVGTADFFGHITCTESQRGMFGVFYDLSSKPSPSPAAPPPPAAPSPPPPPPHSSSLESGQESKLGSHPITPREGPMHYILVTTVSGEALDEYEKMSDHEIVERCVGVLRCMFPKEEVPSPIGHVVSRWGADPFAQMSYSYAAVGSGGDDYDAMAEDLEGRIFFAGEVCVCVLFWWAGNKLI